MLNIKIILGSNRQERFSELLVPWITETAKKFENVSFEVIDPREYTLPLIESATSPASIKDSNYGNDTVNTFAQKIKEADGFIIITPEYNHGYPAVLKNMFDVIYNEWTHKAMAFVAYGSVGGVRAVEQLRQVAPQMNMVTTRATTHIMAPWMLRNEDGSLKEMALTNYTEGLEETIKDLVWWSDLLQGARKG